MKPAKFTYYAPETVAEIIALLGRYGDDARPLAGGQSLVPLMNMRVARPAVLVDLNRCKALDAVSDDDGTLVLGPMVRQSGGERSELVRRLCPLLAQTLHFTGPRAVRNRATIGGSLAHADPVAELPGAALALDATFVIEGANGRRTLKPDAFFVGQLTTAIEPGEFLREIRIPKAAANTVSAFIESGARQEGVAIGGVAAQITLAGEVCQDIRLAAIGVGSGPVRLTATERTLLGRKLSEALITEAAKAAEDDVDPTTDLHATAHYRKRLTVALAERAIKQALAGPRTN